MSALALPRTKALAAVALAASVFVVFAPRTASARPPAVRTNVGPCRILVPIEVHAAYAQAEGQTLAHVTRMGLDAAISEDLLMRCNKARLIVTLPVEVFGRVGTALDALGGNVGLTVDGRVARGLRLRAFGSVDGAWRPGWPDVYQPVLDASLEPTGALQGSDRQSFLAWVAGAGLEWRLARKLTLDVRGQFGIHDTANDVAYDEAISPDHLTPLDRATASGQLTLSGDVGTYRHSTSVAVGHVAYARLFARDAVSGATHATSGTRAANPLETDLTVALTTRHSYRFKAMNLTLWGQLGYEFTRDEFQGYNSRHELDVTVGVKLRPVAHLTLSVAPFVKLAQYTPDGYGVTATHPPLDDGGDVRRSLTVGGRADIEFATLAGRLAPFVRLDWETRSTNFPDYAAWVHPSASPYDIDFDWTRLAVWVGVRSRF